jgi:hypothetical protein
MGGSASSEVQVLVCHRGKGFVCSTESFAMVTGVYGRMDKGITASLCSTKSLYSTYPSFGVYI